MDNEQDIPASEFGVLLPSKNTMLKIQKAKKILKHAKSTEANKEMARKFLKEIVDKYGMKAVRHVNELLLGVLEQKENPLPQAEKTVKAKKAKKLSANAKRRGPKPTREQIAKAKAIHEVIPDTDRLKKDSADTGKKRWRLFG